MSPAVAIIAVNPQSLLTPLLWWQGRYVSCTLYHHHKRSLTMTTPLPGRPSMGIYNVWAMRFQGLAETGERPTEVCPQITLQLLSNIYDFDTNTNTYSSASASATERPATIDTSTWFVKGKSKLQWRTISNFNIQDPPWFKHLSALALTNKSWWTLPLRLSCGSLHCHVEAFPI
jgi:hypothetical protein